MKEHAMDWPEGLLVIKAGGGEGPGEEEDGLRNGGGTIRNRWRNAPRNEGINHLKVGKPHGKGRGNVGVEFVGYLYCKLCRNGGGMAQSKVAKQIITRMKTDSLSI